MVMICFATDTLGKPLSFAEKSGLTFFENGKFLVKKHLKQKKLCLDLRTKPWSVEQILNFSLGLEAGCYCFDKYDLCEDNSLEQIVLCVHNPSVLKEMYKPFAAMANAMRYAKDLIFEAGEKFGYEEYFYEIKRLEYLGLVFAPLGGGRVELLWCGDKKAKEIVLSAPSLKASALGAGLLKMLALQKLPLCVRCVLCLQNKTSVVNDLLAENVLWIKEETKEDEIEKELSRLYQQIMEGLENAKRPKIASVG